MPTGVHLRDVRKQLFDAAERVLLRDGPNALTSRAVTTEADVAKGVLHRYFADFDDFLAELVRDRLARLADQAALLRAAAGTRTVAENLIDALTELFDPVTVALTSLIFFRDELRTRLRNRTGLPILAEARDMLKSYLSAEREQGRIAADATVDSLSLSLIGAAHLLFAGRCRGTLPDTEELEKMVHTVMADVLQRRLL
ncbi:TetR family transcriptional regulator [Amycolatopsis mediterranei S699]|uniref:TetR family transcriptional regulator n=2 Tax=Amycolatopsis mediterranei TaxID=33910 RepID=A0A0H3D6Y8_AMYMU|nr:TetR family transcriptional regulator [Amycolatopsis mediterranei]ADJ45254.1 TetR family transcriptional regulator [Amycolatopsis mediterranei U32]AEK42014.1 TetR family transcriptional regulator [Amycolatopsis mediterranei S699]AFO76965.1 TetR family transcriptional regulator [Amycolatopsis mediterranei S699]AGT84093.1 TetR family transcriptional regulator [Amycolatopsis mediterranei RB]KDO08539.1 TetR family transcriptional regulator [Amycolatopsis mediterranei]